MREFDLEGVFYFNGDSTPVDVKLVQTDSCELEALVIPTKFIDPETVDEGYLESPEGTSPFRIERLRVRVSRSIIAPTNQGVRTEFETKAPSITLLPPENIGSSTEVDIVAYLTNTPHFGTGRQPVKLNLAGETAQVSEQPEGKITHTLRIENIFFSRLDELRKLINDVCWLVSFAAGSLVTATRLEVYRDDELVQVHIDAPMANLDKGVSAAIKENDIKLFLESSTIPYQRSLPVYPLPSLILNGILAKHTTFAAHKLLLMSNFLEILRYNYALNVAIPSGRMRQGGDHFYWLTGPFAKQRHPASFEQILQDFCQNQAPPLSGWNSDFKEIRNQIIHSGILSAANYVSRYLHLHRFCDRVLLAILGWDTVGGHYLPISRPNRTLFSR